MKTTVAAATKSELLARRLARQAKHDAAVTARMAAFPGMTRAEAEDMAEGPTSHRARAVAEKFRFSWA